MDKLQSPPVWAVVAARAAVEKPGKCYCADLFRAGRLDTCDVCLDAAVRESKSARRGVSS